MAMTIGELVANIRADNSDFERGLARSQLEMEGFRLDTNGRLRDLQGHFVSSGGVMERALRGVGDEMGEVARQTVIYSSVVDAESRTMAARFRAVRDAAERMGDSLASRFGRVVAGLRSINIDGDRLGKIGGALGGIAMSVGGIAAKVGVAVPAVAGLVGMLAQVAPAAGVAVSAFIALQLATKTFKLGMVGVGDAVKAAMDPSNPAAFEEAIAKLAPNAKAFAREVKTLAPQFKALQQDVQQKMFEGLDKVLRDMGKSTLPVLRQSLGETAVSLNLMGKSVGEAVIGLSKSGVLGEALDGANTGLANLTQAPGQFLTALTQVAAASGPTFGKMTDGLASGIDSISQKLTHAFESGAMEGAINQAVSILGQLGTVAGNVFSILGSVFSAAQSSGGGMIGVLQQITGSLAEAFASPGVQAGLKAIFETMSMVASTVGPLLVTALGAIAPVFTALGPPIQTLVGALGEALGPVIKALGPVLEAAAQAVGSLLTAFAPLLPVIGSLVAQLLPALTPILTVIGNVFKLMAPLVAQLAGVLMSALAPILAALVPVLEPILAAFMTLVEAILPIITAQITTFAPIIAQLAGIFAQLMVALAPVIAALVMLVANVLTSLMPVVTPIIEGIGFLAGLLADGLGAVITGIVVPALQILTSLLSGDFSGAWEAAKTLVKNVIDSFIQFFRDLPARAAVVLAMLAPVIKGKITEAGNSMADAIRTKIAEFLGQIRAIPGQAASALGNLGSLLWDAGSRLIRGFIDGVKSQIGQIRSTLSGITGMIPDWKGPPETDAKLLTPAGISLIDGFRRGISAATPGLQAQLGGLTGALPGMVPGAMGGAAAGAGGGRLIVEVSGPQEFKGIIRRIVQVDGRGNVQTAFGD